MKPGKVVVIGLDGFDPTLAEGMIERGALPNLAKLRKTYFHPPRRVTTSCGRG
ncbi:MAG: hypothetical protein LJF06_11885 [Gemmatimonadetes bacterium]|nr:hypothetical protein [Gemmatimonadota bacterium]